jgi:phage recombination protein Bet
MPYTANVQADIWRLLTDAIYPASDTDAIVLAIDYCRARGLDVLKKPVHIVSVWNAATGKMVETIFPSIQELQTVAGRTGSWAGMDSPKWGPNVTRTFIGGAWVKNAVGRDEWVSGLQETVEFPEWCEVTVHRMVEGQPRAFSEPVYWLETCATTSRNSELPTDIWVKRPRGQLHKCAKAAALRAAFPEDCSFYSAEEMAGKVIGGDNKLKSIPTPSCGSSSQPPSGQPPTATPQGSSQAGSDSKPVSPETVKANRIRSLVEGLYTRKPPSIDESAIPPEIVLVGRELVQRCKRENAWIVTAEYVFGNQGGKYTRQQATYLLAVLVNAKNGQVANGDMPLPAAEEPVTAGQPVMAEPGESNVSPETVLLGKKFVSRCIRVNAWDNAIVYVQNDPDNKFTGHEKAYLLAVIEKAQRETLGGRQAA